MNRSEINTETMLYGVIGRPVAHSLSPVMQNAAFGQAGHNGVYLAFDVARAGDAVSAIRSLGIGGLSVTIPHKVSVMAYLDAVDPIAEKIGAVNTIVNDNGRLKGYNTDCLGAMKALSEITAIEGKQVVLAGAGGAARAIAFGIVSAGGSLTILNRSQEKAELLARELGARFGAPGDFENLDCDIFINSTSLGMTPEVSGTPIPGTSIKPGMVVMDIVYAPLETRLLKEAREKGATVVDGVSMFVYQGACQFELWTGKKAPYDLMREAVLAGLAGR